MKISIGINIFKENSRQDLCIESLLKCKNIFKNSISLFNLKEEGSDFNNNGFTDLLSIKKARLACNYIPKCTQPLPIVRDFFDSLSKTECDYFIFLNSDIIIHPRFIRFVLNQDYDSICGSRLAIKQPKTIYDTVEHSHYQVAGFDVFCVNKEWWLKNRNSFPEYIYAISAWDVDYGARMMNMSNCYFYNKHPYDIFHCIHDEKSHNNTPEREYNMNLFNNLNKDISSKWNTYLHNVLLKREGVNYITPHKNEIELERIYLK